MAAVRMEIEEEFLSVCEDENEAVPVQIMDAVYSLADQIGLHFFQEMPDEYTVKTHVNHRVHFNTNGSKNKTLSLYEIVL